MKRLFRIVLVIVVLVIVYFLGKFNGDPNKTIIYGNTGLPRNCRAIIDANVKGYWSGIYKADEALNSIERNCGATGYSWGLH